ncbi:helix-turn-helix domain-containing protein [Aporhodopirellula aestuarii]|uniref:Transposase IS204/IS1001/IS1096/IS1165 helix-turn-helix domain-containing protein n=1 Tax=Aporhodopirellula aestuarii TaxID=2950107 RepID=A0ABT0UDP2_9BACT|nr:helix-turn-helix domain-containing protein [Aporhodopirellula aestuarii]MCM2375177.1 hypothetical protein [Aporhodopirellula aestuarii]
MQDKELYQQILGLSLPWTVGDFELDHEASEIGVKVGHPRDAKFCCTDCDAQFSCHDYTEERRWRHPHSCQFKAILIARIPQMRFLAHGVETDVPWAEKHSRFTIHFERFAIDVLLATQTVKGAMSILGTKWDQAWNIVARAVRRGKQRKQVTAMSRIGIDEKAFKKGRSYITLL